MGRMWDAENRALGFELAEDDPILIWGLKLIGMGCHGFYRFFTGRPLFGDRHRKTDAEWSTPGSRKLHQNARTPGWWSWLSERTRALIRIGLLLVLVDIAWGWWDGPFSSPTHGVLTVLGIVFLWGALHKLTGVTVSRFTDRKHDKGLIAPLKAAMAPILGVLPRDVKITVPSRVMKTKGDKKA